MKRIRLTKEEKEAFWILYEGKISTATDLQRISSLSYEFETLEQLGFARCAWTEGHAIEDVAITSKGRRYVDHNPKLRNSVDWQKILAVASVISVIIAALALFIALSLALRLSNNNIIAV